jgi:hypothetical protein
VAPTLNTVERQTNGADRQCRVVGLLHDAAVGF